MQDIFMAQRRVNNNKNNKNRCISNVGDRERVCKLFSEIKTYPISVQQISRT